MLKDILLHVDGGRTWPARLEVAVDLAARFDSHLTGVHVFTHPRIQAYVEAQIPADVMQQQRDAVRQEAEKQKEAFLGQIGRAGIVGECRVVEGDLVDTLDRRGRYSDLVIVSQRDPEADYGVSADMPDALILSVGRPVLVVPYVGQYSSVGKNVLVAWDAGHQAARAVNDALPLLQTADKVDVLAVNPRRGSKGHGDIAGADILHHLARHDVNVEASEVHAEDMEIGDMLLNRAADTGADLVVMGAYGHRRFRELVFGGVTRHMLEHMTTPVLMSH